MDTDRELKLLRDLEALVVVRDNQRAKIERFRAALQMLWNDIKDIHPGNLYEISPATYETIRKILNEQ